MKLMLLVILYIGFSDVYAVTKLENKNNSFVATKEWQEILEGQGIPAGLHVRINLQTGKKEAKLLDETEEDSSENSSSLSAVPENTNEPLKGTTKQKLKLSKTLSDALKNLPKDALGIEYSPEKMEQIKRDFKSYKELKDMQKNFQTDAEIIVQFIDEYRNISKDTELDAKVAHASKRRILENFDYMLHQIDNALVFIDHSGLDHILLPLIVNHTDVNLRIQAMRVLGAVTQNNPKAQIKVFERNFGSHLSQLMVTSTNTDELSTALYAFGSLLRKFPHAQQRILSTTGTQALIAVLTKECELKIKAKAATLISDLIVEKELVISQGTGVEDPVAAAQYADISFKDWLLSSGYCEAMDTLFSSNYVLEFIHQPDLLEYVLQALENTVTMCSKHWMKSTELAAFVLSLSDRYITSDDEFRLELAERLRKLSVAIFKRNLPHEEL